MKKIKNLTITALLFVGIMFQACNDNDTIVDPTPQTEPVISNAQIAEIVAAELSKPATSGSTIAAINDLLLIAQNGSPDDIQDGDLIGLIKNDSTIVYEGDTYKTTLTYDVKYIVNNRIVDDYSLLADTALISYTIESEYDNIQFRGKREAYSTEFIVSDIKMPTTKFKVNMGSKYRSEIEYKLEPQILLYINGITYFKDIVVDVYNAEIESGTGGMEFTISSGPIESDLIIVEVEFVGNNKAVIKVNGEVYSVDVALGLLLLP